MISRITVLFSLFICLTFASINSEAKNWTAAIAPDFKLQDQHSQWQQLKDFKGKWVVVYFYPKDDTPGCTVEAQNFRDTQKDFVKLGVSVLGISIDSIESHKLFSEAHELTFPILSDESKKVSKQYDVLGGFGPISYAKRQTFVIDPDGIIVKHYQDVTAAEHSQQLLEKIPELQKSYSE